MKFSGFIHFGPLKRIRRPFFDKKIAVARENSVNLDFSSKTPYFQIFFKILLKLPDMSTIYQFVR
jgi:hypothetical protein